MGLSRSKFAFSFSERSWIEQGENAGEHVIPLARNFNSTDIESSSNRTVCRSIFKNDNSLTLYLKYVHPFV